MNDPAEAVKDALVTAGIGTFGAVSGWAIYIGQFPARPDTVLLINQVGGRSPFPHLLLNFPTVQIQIRGNQGGYKVTRAQLKLAVDSLLGMSSQVLNGDTYRSCNQVGDVIYLGQDENERPMFSANLTFIVEPAATAGTHRVTIT